MFILFSEVRLGEEEEYQNYLKITPEGFDKLFELVKYDITKQVTNMSDASTSKLKLSAKIFHVYSFVLLLS